MKGHFTKKHTKHKDKNYYQKNQSNTNTKRYTKHQGHHHQIKNNSANTFNHTQPINIHHATVEKEQWQNVKQRNKKHLQQHPRSTSNHQRESVCPKSGKLFKLETRNRYSHLRKQNQEEEVEVEEKRIIEEIQSGIRDAPKKKTDLIDSLMIGMINLFPKSIKNYFDEIEKEIPEELVLPNPNSELNFVQSRIGEDKDDTINIKFMLDQGSSHSVISWDLWEKVPFRHRYELASGTTNFVTTSEASQREVKRVIIPFYLMDSTGKEHKRVYCFYVVDGKLPHQAYLGIDWLQQSLFCIGIFDNYFNLRDIRNPWVHRIPIEGLSNSEYRASINVNLLSDITARPNTTVKALVVAEGEVPDSEDLIIEGLENLEHQNRYSIIPTLTDKTKDNIYEIYIKNNSNKELYIERNTLMGEIIEDDYHQNQKQVIFQQKGKSSYINPITMSNCFLKDHNDSDTQHPHNMASENNHHDMASANNHHDMASENNHHDMASENNHHDMASETDHHDLQKNKDARDKFAKIKARKKLNEIKCLNEDEKDGLMEEFGTKGYFSYPATTLVETNSRITELQPDTKRKTDKELLEELDLSHLEAEVQNRVRGIFQDNIQIFSRSAMDVPACPLITAKPELTEEAKKKGIQNTKFRPIPAQIKDKVDSLLDDMIAAGILRVCDKPTHIVSNLIVTPKKNSELRVCLDLRTVNSQVLRIPYQLEPLHSVFQSFHNAKYTTSIDLSNSYFSCAIEESRQPIFSFFNSRRQLLSYARCPMGFVNSGYYLEQISTKIKERCPNVVSFVDDLYLISYEGDSWRDHCNKLEDLVKILVEFNLKIKAKKVQALAVTMDVLGHEWAVDRFKIPDNRVDGIIQWETPTDGDEVATFLGHCGFYRDYLPEYSEAVLPLQPLATDAIEYKKKRKLARKTKEKVTKPTFIWTEIQANAFDQVKEMFKNSTSRYPPDPKEPYHCYSDASKYCASYITMQVINGKRRLIGACSRKFSKSEINYSVFKKEVKATMIGLEVFKDILHGAKIHLYVDARSILFLKATSGSDQLLMRWALIMSTFDIEISHISSEANFMADSMSRSLDKTKEDDGLPPLSEQDATKLLKQIELPESYTIDRELFEKYMTSDGMKSPIKKSNKKNTTKAIITSESLKPPNQSRRKVNLPKTSEDHIYYKDQRKKLREQPPDFLKEGSSEKEHENMTAPEGNHSHMAKAQTQESIMTAPEKHSECYKGHKAGHMSRECPLNQPQKVPDHVPDQEDAKDIKCHTCKRTGHFSRNCPDKFSKMSCYNCGKKGHLSRECPDKVGGCQKTGHLSRDGKDETGANLRMLCYNCHGIGHKVRDCKNHQKVRPDLREGGVNRSYIAQSGHKDSNKRIPHGNHSCRTSSRHTPNTGDNTVYWNHINIKRGKKDVTIRQLKHLNQFINNECFMHNTTLEKVNSKLDQERIRINNRIYKDGLISISLFRECQSLDPTCENIKNDIDKNKLFFTTQGVLCKRLETSRGKRELLVLPRSLLAILRHTLHFGILGQHASANNMYLKLRDHYFFPNLQKELMDITRSCILCATLKPNIGKQLELGQKQYPNSPRVGWAFDIGCAFPPPYQYCYIFLDLFCGYVVLVPAKSKSSKEILKAFKEKVIKYFDYPNYLYGDNESALHSGDITSYCEAHKIDLRYTSPHSPQSNGYCELQINKVKTTLRMLVRSQGKYWSEMVTEANLGINHRKLANSPFSPQMLALGQESQTLALLKESEEFRDQQEYSDFITKRLDMAYKQHREMRKISADKSRAHANKSRIQKAYQVGQLVTLKNHEIASVGGGSMKDKYHGVYQIQSLNEKEKTCILIHIDNGSERGAHLRHLRKLGDTDLEDPLPIRNEAIRLLNKNNSSTELGTEGRSYNLRSNKKQD